jgi:hypothetical protein
MWDGRTHAQTHGRTHGRTDRLITIGHPPYGGALIKYLQTMWTKVLKASNIHHGA